MGNIQRHIHNRSIVTSRRRTVHCTVFINTCSTSRHCPRVHRSTCSDSTVSATRATRTRYTLGAVTAARCRRSACRGRRTSRAAAGAACPAPAASAPRSAEAERQTAPSAPTIAPKPATGDSPVSATRQRRDRRVTYWLQSGSYQERRERREDGAQPAEGGAGGEQPVTRARREQLRAVHVQRVQGHGRAHLPRQVQRRACSAAAER